MLANTIDKYWDITCRYLTHFFIQTISELEQAPKIDCVVLAIAQGAFTNITLEELNEIMNERPILIDVLGFMYRERSEEEGLY